MSVVQVEPDVWEVDGEGVMHLPGQDPEWICTCNIADCWHVDAIPGAASPVRPAPVTPTLDSLHVPGHDDLPDWVTDLRPHQWAAVDRVMELYRRGVKVVFLDAPTGSGKTLIGEAVRRRMAREGIAKNALYVCSDRGLQDQFVADFPYAQVLKGRTNYATLTGTGDITCGDCTKAGADDDCNWCDPTSMCPYVVAKGRALRSPLAVLNTAYLMSEANGPGAFAGRGLTIIDECDVLEDVLMGFVEFRVTDRQARRLGVEAPKKGSHLPTLLKWIAEELQPAVERTRKGLAGERSLWGDVKKQRELNQYTRLAGDVATVLRLADKDNWVRDNDAPMALKPITVDAYGKQVLWRHSEHWLLMSATIISPEQMVESLGVEGGEGEEGGWGIVSVPMTFPVENRPIVQSPVANMTKKEKDTAWPAMVDGIAKVLERHEGERVLVHAVSYELAAYLAAGLAGCGRRVVTYRNPREKDAALRTYRSAKGAVLVASSMDRGVDLKDDDCRVVIVAKVPFPYLGDPQVGKRMHLPGGQEWYAVQTVRSVVQMTGRGVRSADDWAVTYVLDGQFTSNLWKRNKRLFPGWWRDAVQFVPRTQLMKGQW